MKKVLIKRQNQRKKYSQIRKIREIEKGKRGASDWN
jgi:hypothetical protein